MEPRPRRLGVALWLLVSSCVPGAEPARVVLVENVLIVDGSGAQPTVGDVRVVGDRIDALGDLPPEEDADVIDGTGLALAPGFIDTHSHHDRGLFEQLDARACVSQGITTIVVGQDGGSHWPLREFAARVDSTRPAVNVAAFSGHNTLRRRVLEGDYRRPATDAEVAAMARLLGEDLDAGALGLSTGLEYDPGIYSTTNEVVALARVAGAAGGRYISHIRSEDRHLPAAVDEILRVGSEAGVPVQITHMKLAMRALWGNAPVLLAKLDSARAAGIDVTADVYPYEYWQSTMTVLLPDRNFEDRAAFVFALEELAPPDDIILTDYDPRPEYVGRSLAEIAASRGEDPVTTYMALVAESQALAHETGENTESVMGRSMHPADIAAIVAWPHSNLSTDGMLDGRHPRGYGAFPRAFRQFVSDSGAVSLATMVRKATALAAEHVGLSGRGRITSGAPADLVLFDPATIADRATIDTPHATSAGIVRVWVNGRSVWTEGAPTGERPGRFLPRPERRTQ